MDSTTLVFSLAINGYQHLYENELKSHAEYAKKYGFDYARVEKPSLSLLGLESAWIKLVLIMGALKLGYKEVLYLDADTLIRKTAPNILQEFDSNKYIYMAPGFSGRINSGVILIKYTPEIIKWLETMIINAELPVSKEDNVGWGENGHVAYTKNSPLLKILSNKWNNNINSEQEDYIRHYSAGPMRANHKATFKNRTLYKLIQLYIKALRRIKTQQQPFLVALSSLYNSIRQEYPNFFAECEIPKSNSQNASLSKLK